jgi:putative ABC transport system permease protein
METLLKDLKHSLRMFVQSPGFTIAALSALALGIAANTATFSVVDTVLLRPAPYPEPGRLVVFSNTHSGVRDYRTDYLASIMKFVLWRRQTGAFENVSAYRYGVVNLTGAAYPEQLQSARVSVDYFRAFGSLPMTLGRTFSADEDRPNGGRVAVISDGLWKRRFGGDPHAIGATISLSGESYEIVGIAAPGARTEKDPPTEVWMPLQLDPESLDQNHFLTVVGRLKPGVTLGMAKAQLQLAADELRQRFPAVMNKQSGFTVLPIRDFVIGDAGPSLWILLGAVSFVLLIACSNVANLLLIRATSRRREIAIRAAMGAGRGRILRQLLTESVLLAVVGGALGLALGMLGVHALLALNPGNIPRIGDHGSAVHLDWRVLTFTTIASLITGILFGLIPALQLARTDLSVTLKESGGRSGTGFRQNKARSLLVVSEITLAVVLLMGAALLIRTFIALRTVNPGFDVHNVLVAKMSLADQRFEKTAGVAKLVRDGIQGLNTVPGVLTAGAACCVPLEGDGFLSFTVVDRPLNGPVHGYAGWTSVSAEYFNIFKIPLLRGRAFTDRDDGNAPGVVIVNQTMARQLWPQSDPLRDRLFIAKGAGPLLEEPARQIVGIVGDVRDMGLNRDPRPTMYVPISQVQDGINAASAGFAQFNWLVRIGVEPRFVASAIKAELQASAGMPVTGIRSMDEIVAESTSRQDFNMVLMTIFGGSSLLLAAIGIYAMMAYSVQQRTQEIGIRLALGADSSNVRNMIVFQGLRLALIGVALGIAAALALTRLVIGFLFGVKAWDPLVFTSVPVLLSAIALFAVWLPARRASRIDPIEALRHE